MASTSARTARKSSTNELASVPSAAGVPVRLDLGAMLVVVGEWRECHLRLSRLAVAQDQQAFGSQPLGPHLAAQGGGRQRREPRVQRGEDGFARGGQVAAGR